ncbi:MAG: amidohydrolase family protein [Microcoleus anatoxicus]|uniref:amidohydrolase family protein n=1 Tax=Microcoleus anatoxicus TaxID=2705319 RepID=UPI00366C456D
MHKCDRQNLCRHAHLLETRAQKQLAQEKYGCSAVAHLQQIGFLSSRTSLAHCVWLDDADIAIMAETKSTVVHNPLSNLRLGSGIAPILKYRQAGVNVSFGCDGAARACFQTQRSPPAPLKKGGKESLSPPF